MHRTFLSALVLLAAAPALAQTQVIAPPGLADTMPKPPPPKPLPPGGVIVSADGQVVISSTVCADVARAALAVPGADYTPGVDVRGDAVAPADLPGAAPPVQLDNFPIEISVNLQKRFGIPADAKLFHGKAIVGLVTMRDGRAYFNGEPITDNEHDMIVAACKEARR